MALTNRSEVMRKDEQIVHLLKSVDEMCSQPFVNRGRGLDEVEERQRRRKIKNLQESCKRALWFTDSFNIDVLSIVCRMRKSKETISIDVPHPSPPPPTSTPPTSTPSSSTPSTSSSSPTLTSATSTNDSSQLRKVLYLLDRFGVSDEFYHELSMVNSSLSTLR